MRFAEISLPHSSWPGASLMPAKAQCVRLCLHFRYRGLLIVSDEGRRRGGNVILIERKQQGLSFSRQSLKPAELDALAHENLFIRESLPATSFGAKWRHA